MPVTYTVRRNVMVPMRDGVQLASDVYLPEGDALIPTLLQRTPYDKDEVLGTQFIVQISVMRALDAGFALVIQDTRGRFASQGSFDPFVHESDDGADTVAWIGDQDFSDGRVVTYGASYVGATQMLLAMQGVSEHVAMAPLLTAGSYHEFWTYRGGALQLGFIYMWVIEALAEEDIESRQLPAGHPARLILDEFKADPAAAMARLPACGPDLVELAPYVADWLGNPSPDTWWPEISPITHLDRVTTPALHIAGFNDIFLDGSLASYSALRHDGASKKVRDGQYLVVGPWSHANIGDWQGQTWLGYGAHAAAFDLGGVQLEFFRAVLEGRRPDFPRVQYFSTGVNQWRSSDEWPPAGVDASWYLASGGRLTSRPEAEVSHRFVSDTLQPVPTTGGATFLPGIVHNVNDGPHDQRDVEARDDVLTFRSDLLTEDVCVSGRVTLELEASSSATDCDWTARLVEVDDLGRALGVVDGVLRARYRKGWAPQPLTPGVRETFEVELGHISHVFRAGHRLGLQVASSNFPRFDRNPQQMCNPVQATEDDFVVAQQTVFSGGPKPSRLILPTTP